MSPLATPDPWSTVSDAARELPSLEEIESSATLVHRTVRPTAQYHWPLLSERTGAETWVKHENHTAVGAFKLRGGLVYIDALTRGRSALPGVVTATRGNHGQSIGLAAARAGLPCAVVVPEGNSREKNAAMQALGVELLVRGEDFQDAVDAADALARERGWHRIPSFHPWLVRGVATYALELFRGAPPLDAVYVPIGLGSGICGVIAARDALGLSTAVVGVTSTAAPAFARSLDERGIVSHAVTTRIADGAACRTPVAAALAIVARGAERVVSVSDDEVEQAMRALFHDTHNVAEGAGAMALAGLLQDGARMRGRRVAVICSGGNVDTAEFARVLAAGALA